jgi:hypothetical protein
MTADRQTMAWARQYQEFLNGFVEALGGEQITPIRRALASQLATLQTELARLSDRFAAGGKGASSEDLNQFLKISGQISELLRSAGLTAAQQAPVVDQRGDDAREKLVALLTNLARCKQEDEANGIFRDASGAIITDEKQLAVEQQIYALRHGLVEPAPVIAASAEPAKALPSLRVVPPAAEPPKPPTKLAARARGAPVDRHGKPIPGIGITALAYPNASLVEARRPPPPDLFEKHNELSRSRADLEKQRGRLCEEVLSNPARRVLLDETTAKLAAVDSELAEIKTKMAAWQAAQSTTDSYLEWSARGGDSRITDWSLQSNPSWDHLR